MALLRSGRITSVSSGLSIVSSHSCVLARGADQNKASIANGLMIHDRESARKTLSLDGVAEQGRACLPTASVVIKNSDEDLKKSSSKVSPECDAPDVTRLVLCRRLVRPALQELIGGDVWPGLANPDVR